MTNDSIVKKISRKVNISYNNLDRPSCLSNTFSKGLTVSYTLKVSFSKKKNVSFSPGKKKGRRQYKALILTHANKTNKQKNDTFL